MSGGIIVKEFKYIPGVNDAEYIKKLEELHEIDKGIINKAVAKIKMLSAQSERKVGKWIKDKSWSEGAGMGESYGHYWKCNQCNNIVKGDWSQCGDNFCSECGADMRTTERNSNV